MSVKIMSFALKLLKKKKKRNYMYMIGIHCQNEIFKMFLQISNFEKARNEINWIGKQPPHLDQHCLPTSRSISNFCRCKFCCLFFGDLTLKVSNKNCSRRHFNFLLSSFEENKAWYFMWILCLAEDSHETSSFIFSEKQWKYIYEYRLLQSWLAL